ncbi:hypothetical protein ACFLT7_04890 [candidate division KSB1 bacterium]
MTVKKFSNPVKRQSARDSKLRLSRPRKKAKKPVLFLIGPAGQVVRS